MGMEEVSYFLLQIVQMLHKIYERNLPAVLQQLLDELSQKVLPSHYTKDVDVVINILWVEYESTALFFGPYHKDFDDYFNKDIKMLRDDFDWKYFFETFLIYMDIAIIYICDDKTFTKLYRGFVKVLEHHKTKDNQMSSWKEMDRMVTSLAEEYKETEREQAAVNPENIEPIREFVLRTFEYIYKLQTLELPQKLRALLDEIPGNRCLNQAVEKAIRILVNDPKLAAKVDEAELPLTVRDVLEACVYRSKAAAARAPQDLRKNETNTAVFLYETSLTEFIELRSVMPLNLIMGKIQITAADIIAMDDENDRNGTSTDAAISREDVDMLVSNMDNSDAQQLVDSSPDEDWFGCKKLFCSPCSPCRKKLRRT